MKQTHVHYYYYPFRPENQLPKRSKRFAYWSNFEIIDSNNTNEPNQLRNIFLIPFIKTLGLQQIFFPSLPSITDHYSKIGVHRTVESKLTKGLQITREGEDRGAWNEKILPRQKRFHHPNLVSRDERQKNEISWFHSLKKKLLTKSNRGWKGKVKEILLQKMISDRLSRSFVLTISNKSI